MNIDYCLVLAAGKGTRMGAIGKHLPKILWPVFEKTILELQLSWAQRLGFKKIFINTHHHDDQVHKFVEEKNLTHQIEVLNEKKLLLIGGAIHNLARKFDYKGKVLVLNGDQFLTFSEKFLNEQSNALTNNAASIFLAEVTLEENYGETVVNESGHLIDIIPRGKVRKNLHYTYSGCGLIDFEKIEPVSGPSNFFQSVANFKKYPVITRALNECEYWDFGTLDRYINSVTALCSGDFQESVFFRFLKSNDAIKNDLIGNKSYGPDRYPNKYNFSQQIMKYFSQEDIAIILSAKEPLEIAKPGFYWNGIYQPLSLH